MIDTHVEQPFGFERLRVWQAALDALEQAHRIAAALTHFGWHDARKPPPSPPTMTMTMTMTLTMTSVSVGTGLTRTTQFLSSQPAALRAAPR